MELIAIWQMIKRRWWLIAIPGLVAFLVTLPQLPNIVSPPISYSVALRLTAAVPPDAVLEGVPSSDLTTPYEDTVYVPLLASEYVVVNMPHWIASDSFAEEVAAVLSGQNMAVELEDLRGAFVADSFRSILVLYVYWDDAAEIQSIAAAAVTVLQTRNQSYFAQFAIEPLRVMALDDFEVVEVAPPITARITPLLRIAIGLAAGLALAVLAEYLDRTVYTREDLEALDLPVLGEIPGGGRLTRRR